MTCHLVFFILYYIHRYTGATIADGQTLNVAVATDVPVFLRLPVIDDMTLVRFDFRNIKGDVALFASPTTMYRTLFSKIIEVMFIHFVSQKSICTFLFPPPPPLSLSIYLYLYLYLCMYLSIYLFICLFLEASFSLSLFLCLCLSHSISVSLL